MTEKDLHNIALKLLKAVSKSDYDVTIYQVINHVSYYSLINKFEDCETFYLQITKPYTEIVKLKGIFKEAGLKIKIKRIRCDKELAELGIEAHYNESVFRFKIIIDYLKDDYISNRFEIIDI